MTPAGRDSRMLFLVATAFLAIAGAASFLRRTALEAPAALIQMNCVATVVVAIWALIKAPAQAREARTLLIVAAFFALIGTAGILAGISATVDSVGALAIGGGILCVFAAITCALLAGSKSGGPR